MKGAQRFWAADTVGGKAVLALVRHQCVVGLQSEVSVDQAGVEAQILQPRLQRGHVVAEQGSTELVIQRARTEPVRGLLERPVGGLADDAVHQQATMLLKGTDRLVEFGVEEFEGHVPASVEVVLGAIQQAQRDQRRPDLGHSSAVVPTTQRVAVFAARTRHTKGPPGLLTSSDVGNS